MVYLNWKQKYEDQIQNSQLMSSDTMSLVLFFEQDTISAKEYLQWAQNDSMLPILRDDFFDHFSHQNAIDLVNKYVELKEYWSPLCVPIGEWDGHLIVAGCFFEPIETSHSLVPILTNFSQTRVVWDFLRLHLAASSYANEIPQEVVDASQFSSDSGLEETKKFYLKDLEELDETKTVSSIDLSTETVKIDKPVEDPTFDFLQKLEIPTPQIALELADESKTEAVVITGLTEENTNFPVSEPYGGLEGLSTENPVAEGEESHNLPTFADEPSQPIAFEVPPDEITNVGYKFNSLESWNAVRAQWSELQDEMAIFFDRTILVSINSELESFTEVIWSTSVSPVELGLSLTLKEPSLFRVVFTTFKPYHGNVINNPVNQSFMTNWNDGQVPAHITVAPVIVNQNIKGMLIGIGNISAYSSNALALAEKMSERIAELIKSANSSNPSAA